MVLVLALVLTDSDDSAPVADSQQSERPEPTEPTPAAADEDVSDAAGPTDTAPAAAPTTETADDTTVATTPVPEPVPDTAAPAPTTTIDPLVPDLEARGLHPPLVDIDGWLQSDISSLEELRGKVVAVQFWTFGCSNCKATLPHMQALYEKYGGDDFEIVGVHAPEFDYERDADRIAQAAADLGVTWPIALDTEKRTFRSWQTDRRFWPRIYLIDRDGEIRYDKIGEGKYDVIDAAVGALIAETP